MDSDELLSATKSVAGLATTAGKQRRTESDLLKKLKEKRPFCTLFFPILTLQLLVGVTSLWTLMSVRQLAIISWKGDKLHYKLLHLQASERAPFS